MPFQKNQHFVPKVHLTPFTTNGDGKSISLLNLKSDKVIHGAPIKHQCAKSYFYGEDRELEELFGALEGRYADVVRAVVANNISESDIGWLNLFMVLQYARTQAAVDRYRAFLEKAAAVTLHGKSVKEDKRPNLTHEALIRGSLRQLKALMPYSKDLKFCVFHNLTRDPFVTSDNPLIFTNRFYSQKLKSDAWGIASAGAMLFLPLGPQFVSCFYDSGMYIVGQNHSAFVSVTKLRDIQAFNEMQYLHAHQNVYFSNPTDGDRHIEEFHSVKQCRPSETVRLLEFAAIEEEAKGARYIQIKPGTESASVKKKLIALQIPKPLLARWPSVISFRSKKVFYSDGSTAGYLRKPEWLKGMRPHQRLG